MDRDIWKPAFGRHWSPRDFGILKRLGLLSSDLKDWEAGLVVSGARDISFNAMLRGALVGWTAALVLMALL